MSAYRRMALADFWGPVDIKSSERKNRVLA
jgi:hypothetical protein